VKILLTGAAGQLGQELYPLLDRLGTVTAVDLRAAPGAAHSTVEMDLSDLNKAEILLNRTGPAIIVNAAAYTAVDQAENEPRDAFRVNAELPARLAAWAARNNALLFHYSTDYVFDGAAEHPYREDDRPSPINVYGESKLEGEVAVASSWCQHVILRTSWVYSSHGSNFVLSMLRLARERPELNIVSDQVGCPTWARNLARVSEKVLRAILSNETERDYNGLFHYCDAGVVSWYDFAARIFRLARDSGLLEDIPAMNAVASSSYPQVAERPRYSVLDTSAIRELFGVEPAGLNQSLQTCLEEI
jgi:dTDP-4-dehydrorhamnose reductase